MQLTAAIALLLIGLTVTNAGPLHHKKHHRRHLPTSDAPQCAQRCTGTESKYAYKPGHSYVYTLKSSTDVEISHSSKHNTNVTQVATVTISVHAPCEYQMKIDSLTITGTDTPSTFVDDITSRPIRFAMDDGRIEAVCPEDGEPTWVLNMKRSILSALQNAFEADDMKVDEEDVAGKCQTNYKRERDGEDWTYIRRKNVHSCRGHHNIHGALRAQAYDTDSDVQSAPISNADHECRHRVDNHGILQLATCTEWHKFTPFSTNEEQGGMVKSTTRMTIKFVKESNTVGTQSSSIHRKALAYDNSEMDYAATAVSSASAHQSLRQLCEISAVSVAKETPSKFYHLVAALRQLKREHLAELIGAGKSAPICSRHSQFLMDALPMCGSEQCVEAMIDILKSNTLSESDRFAWYTALAFVPKATKDMLRALVPLVDNHAEHKRGLLGVSSLVRTFCDEHPDCAEDDVVKTLVNKLNTFLGQSCHVDTTDVQKVEQMVFVLKALGNIGHVHSAAEKLLACSQSRSNPVHIRVAAVQALRRLPCDHEQRAKLMQQFRSSSTDVEVRINAFLVLIKCPSRSVIDEINDQLGVEQVKQVGSFVWSYLNEHRASDDPTQQTLRNLLRDTNIRRRFDLDARRYSRYSHTGQFSTSANSGAHIDGTTIFVPGSHTPRAASANLTVHMFGHSVNFFEIGGRAQGLDQMLESVLGPDGMFSSSSRNYGEAKDNGEYNELADKQKKRPHYEAKEQLQLSMYGRVFGDELFYFGYDDANVMDSVRANADYKAITQFLATQRKFEMAKNLIFLDFTKSLPTMAGLPLRLSVTGVASLNIKVDGRADLTQMMKRASNIHIESSVKPSAAIEIATSLSVVVGGVSSGVRLVSRMHTNTAVDSEFSVKDGKTIKATWAVPDDKQTVVDVEFTGYGVVNNLEVPMVEAVAYESDTFCTPDGFSNMLGLKHCVGYSKPKEAIHMFPRRAWFSIDKTDDKLSKYEITLETEPIGVLPMPKRFTFDTPGSNVNRRVQVSLDKVDDRNVLNVDMPERKWSIQGDMNMEAAADESNGQLTLTVDDRDKYVLDAVLKRSGAGAQRQVELTATATLPNRDPIVFKSHLNMDGFTKIDAGVNMKGLESVDTDISGKIHLPSGHDEAMLIHLHYLCPRYENKFELESKNNHQNEFLAKLFMEHKSITGSYAPVTFKLNIKRNVEKDGEITIIRRQYELTKSLHPMSNFDLTSETRYSSKYGKFDAKAKYGNQLSHEVSLMIERQTEEDGKWVINGQVDAQPIHLQQKLKASYNNNYPRLLHIEAQMQALSGGDEKSVEFKLQQPSHEANDWQWIAEATAKYPAKSIDYRLYKHIEQKSQHDFKSKTIIQWKTAHQIEVNGDVKMQQEDNEFHYSMDGNVKITGVDEDIHIHKTVHIAANEYRYKASLKSGTKSIYDGELKVAVRDNKTTWESHLESHYLYKGKYELNGNTEESTLTRNVHIDVRRHAKDYARFIVALPKAIVDNNDKHVKAHLTWDMDVSPKELMSEYRLTHMDEGRRHQFSALTKLNATAHKWESVIVRNGHYTMNSTYWQNDKSVLTANWGLKYSIEHQHSWDFALKSDAPLTAQHFVGEGLVSRAPGDLWMKAEGKCLKTNRRTGVEFRLKNAEDNSYEVLAEIEAIDAGLRFENKWTHNDNKIEMFSNSRLKWAADKQITRVSNFLKEGSTLKYDDKMVTPFDVLKDYEIKYERRCESESTCVNNGLFTMNSEQRLKVNLDSTITGDNKERRMKIVTNYPSIGEIDALFKNKMGDRDGMQEQDFEVSIAWAEHNKLKVHRQFANNEDSTRTHYLALTEVALKEYTNSKARFDYKQDNKKHNVDVHVKRNDDDYKVSADFDELSEKGTVRIQSPHEQLKTAEINVVKKDDGEYEVSTERNGQQGAQLTGTIKSKQHHRAAHLKVDNIATPIEIEVLMDLMSDNERKLKLIVTKNYASDTPQPYGVNLITSPSRYALTVVHPKRRPHVEWRSADNEKQLWLQADTNDAQEPTKIIARYSSDYAYSLTLNDPNLSAPVVVTASLARVNGQCPQGVQLTTCDGSHIHYTVAYTNNELNKMLIDWYQLSGPQHTRHVEVGVRHPLHHFSQRWYMSAVRDLDNPAEVLIYQVGVDSKRDESSEMKNYMAQLIYNMQTHVSQIKLCGANGATTVHFQKDVATNEYRVMFVSDATQQTSWVIAFTGDSSATSPKHQLEIRRQLTSDVVFHASQQMPNEQTIEGQVWHKDANNKRQEDVLIRLWLEQNNLLKLRVHVAPMYSKEWLRQMFTASSDEDASHNGGFLLEVLGSNVAHYGHMSTDICDALSPMTTAWKAEFDELQTDLGTTSGLYDTVADYVEMVLELLRAQLDIVELTIKDVVKSDGIAKWKHNLNQIKSSIMRAIDEMSEPLGEGYRVLLNTLKEFAEQLNSAYADVQKMMQENSYFTELKATLTRWTEYLKRASNYDDFRRELASFTTGSSDQWTTYSRYWDSSIVRSLLRGVYGVIEPAVDELAVFDLKHILSRLVAYGQELIEGQTQMNKYLPKVTYFKPEEGQVELQLPLPVRASSLNDLVNQVEPDVIQRYFERVQSKLIDIVSSNGLISDDLWETTGSKPSVKKMASDMAGGSLAPQHESTAIITGQGNIVTFDGASIALTSQDCEYLLARDFVNGKFTITASLAAGALNVVKVKFGEDTVHIYKDGKIVINGANSQLPWQKMDTFEGSALIKAVRHDHGVELSTFDGARVSYDWYNQLCTVTLPGYMHGQSNGLLGSNDHESSNDLYMPDGEQNDDVSAFAVSWVVGDKKCSVAASEQSSSDTRRAECDQLFRMRQSTLRSCFNHVAPRAFHTLCLTAVDKCNATAAYVTACKATGIDVQIPEDCLTCRKSESSSSETIIGGEESQVTSRHSGADVVFIVEERPCMKFIKSRLVNDVADKIVANLGGLNGDVHFGVIGYGGEEVHNAPHFHTANDAINFGRSALSGAVDSLTFDFEAEMGSSVAEVDPLVAIEYATTHYPFRPTVAKTVVLFACTECGSQADYYAIQQSLLTHNIQLHVFTTQMIQVNNIDVADVVSESGEGNEATELLGFAANTLYTTNGEQPEKRASLASPHDACTVLAQEVNGTVWSVHDEESAMLDVPMRTLASRVAQSHSMNTCLMCECDAFELAPRTTCVTCDVPVPVSLTGTSFFNVPYIKLKNTLKKAQQSLGAVDAWLI